MNCLLFSRSCSVLTELGKDQEVTVPTFKPAAFKADGRESIPALSPKPLLPASRENSKTGRKGEECVKPYFQCRRQPLSWVCLSPHGRAKPVALPESAGSEQRHRVNWNFCISSNNQKETFCPSKLMMLPS